MHLLRLRPHERRVGAVPGQGRPVAQDGPADRDRRLVEDEFGFDPDLTPHSLRRRGGAFGIGVRGRVEAERQLVVGAVAGLREQLFRLGDALGLRGELAVGRGRALFVVRRFGGHERTGDRLAQLVIVPVLQVAFNIVDEFDASTRGAGGFGSTGKA